MLLAARLLARLPGHALYLNNKYLIAWLVFVYVLFTAAALLRGPVKRRYLHGWPGLSRFLYSHLRQ